LHHVCGEVSEMKIVENPELAAKMAEKLKKFRTFRDGEKIHRSDLIYCPRKAYFRIKGYEEKETDRGAVSKKRIGESLHVLFEVCERNEVDIRKDGVVGRVDMLADPDLGYVGEPIELKSTRGKLLGPDWIELQHREWVDQLETACLFTEKPRGHLSVLQVISGDLKVYTMTFTPEEMEAFWKKKSEVKMLLSMALDVNDYKPLPKGTWECRNCGFTEVCVD
jgi:CRISPR/Cas system-associated exonuclease Cas4 (RecB family)